jgi:ubiquinol-cytochrome c reductase iron-sulfur subunit
MPAEPTDGTASVPDEHQPDEHRPDEQPLNRRAYVFSIIAFSVAVVGGLTAAWAYWNDHTEHLLGIGLALALAGIGFGLVSWAKFLDLPDSVVQHRERLRTTEDERDDFGKVVDMTAATVGRRKLLVALLAGSFGSLIVGFVGPIGSLGPKPEGQLKRTAWSPGLRLVTDDGSPIGIDEGRFDQLSTVFPEGYIGRDDSQVVLLRMRPEELTDKTMDNGSLEGWVAYSKICTHAGCSVGLLGVDDRPPETLRQLVCPCHQSVFDPTDAAKPVGGHAPRSLPQLPLAVDADGFLVALSDFDRPVGPITWNGA